MPAKRSERLFHLINILRSGTGYSAPELAELTGVSLRSIYRDVVDLSVLVPVYYDKGYRLLPDSYIANLAFTREELMAIKLGMGVRPLAEASHHAAASRSALSKIDEQLDRRFGTASPSASRDIALQVEAYTLTRGTMRTLRVLEEATTERRAVEINYRAGYRDQKTKREVDPYGLTFRVRAWYLIGYCHLRRCTRVFRVDRVAGAKILPRKFERPPDFSLDGFFADSWEVYAGAARGHVILHFSPHLNPTVKPRLARWGEFREEDSGPLRLVFEGDVPISDEFARWCMNFGGEAEVVAPAKLREMVIARIIDAAALYGCPAPAASSARAPARKPKRR